MKQIRRMILRFFYPMLMRASKGAGRHAQVLQNQDGTLFQTPIYDIPVVLGNGTLLDLKQWKGQKLLIVNTASDCGYTAQYAELQHLQQRFSETLHILAVPSNDFNGQEPGTNEAIAGFCTTHYGVTFPLAQKSSVRPGPGQHPLFQWLTQPAKNGWNAQAPRWNFSKYLINEHGALTHYFDPAVSPLSNEVQAALVR